MWDVFIAHASEDKDILVRPLAKVLKEVYKVDVWYDEFSLEYGDSLLESIEEGLRDSKFGVIIFSENFFGKKWTTHEYISLKTKEMLHNDKNIIPIWYNINKEDIAKYSLSMTDKIAITVNGDYDIDDIAIKIIKIIRPDIYKNINRMIYFESLLKESVLYTMSLKEFNKIPISIPPIRHKTISNLMKARLKLIHNSIKEVDSRSYELYEDHFRRSINIDREIIITELITAAYIDCINESMSLEEKSEIYLLSLGTTLSGNTQYRNLSIDKKDYRRYVQIIRNYLEDIDSQIVMEYKAKS